MDPSNVTINMIFVGSEVNGVTFLVEKKTKISVSHIKRLREVEEDNITFTEDDADRHLGNFSQCFRFQIKHVLVDPGSSFNIIQWRVHEQAKLTSSIVPMTKLLVGFNLTSMTTREEILLLTRRRGNEDCSIRSGGW